MTTEETKQAILEDIARYKGYVESDKREVERAKMTLSNDQRLLKLCEKHLSDLAEISKLKGE